MGNQPNKSSKSNGNCANCSNCMCQVESVEYRGSESNFEDISRSQ